MKSLILSVLCLFSAGVFAAEAGEIIMSAPKTESLTTEKSNLTEGGFDFTSINNGSMFATVGVFHEFDNGFAMGLRGYMPLQFSKQTSAYMAQAVGRFIILNDIDQMFVEGTIAQGFFNAEGNGEPFVTIGSDFGYMHHFDGKFALGGTLGLDYSNDRIANDELSGGYRTLYNKISAIGAYYF